jgi:hypothetical protein
MPLSSVAEVLLSLVEVLGDILQSIGLSMGGSPRRKRAKQPKSGTGQ